MRLHIDEVVEARQGTPLLLHFQNGYITDEFRGDRAQAALLTDEADRTVAAAEVGGALYAGRQEAEGLGRTLLLARNKTTGKVRIIEVGGVSMKAVLRSATALPSAITADSLELSRKFGSKREKQKMEQRERLKVNPQTMTDQLKGVADDTATVDRIDLKTYSKTDSEDFYIPPINRNAESVREVYDVNAILSPEQVEKITGEIEAKDFKSELEPYVKAFAARRERWSETEWALILYASSLLKLYLTMAKDLVKKTFKVCEASATINEICLADFTQHSDGKRTRPNQYKDKTLCHVMVVLLLLGEYRLELAALAAAARAAPATLATKTRALGAHLSADKRHVVLKLPLNSARAFISRRKSAKF